jgi:hypothetical protein
MIRRRLISAFPLLLLGAARPAAAEEVAPKQVGQYVDLLPVALPVVVDGQLANYVFVYLRLILAPGADTARWRAKEPFFRDALVRLGHATPFTRESHYDEIDAARLSAAFMREAASIAGPGVIRAVVVTKQVASRRARALRD